MPDVLRYTAFSDDPAGGNPAGVVLDAAGMSEPEMLARAAEVGYSETAFLVPRDGDGRVYDVRYFAPEAEVPFCGHATIASAVAVAERTGAGALTLIGPAARSFRDVLRHGVAERPLRAGILGAASGTAGARADRDAPGRHQAPLRGRFAPFRR